MFSHNTPSAVSYKKIAADCYTPVGILDSLSGKMLLESAYHETGKGKYSILILDEAFTAAKEGKKYYIVNNGKSDEVKAEGFLELISSLREKAPVLEEFSTFPVPLGGSGYLGYEFFDEIEDVSFTKENYRNIYDSAFIFGRSFMVFDHSHDDALIVTVRYSGEEGIDTDELLSKLESRIKASANKMPEETPFTAKIVSPDGKKEYMNNVVKIKDEIYKGNLIQCVISRTTEIESDVLPINAYRNLRRSNPSPYMFFLNYGSYIIYGASPEVMVKYKNGNVTVRPIAGTRKRGKDAAQDILLEEELKKDIKENAEHLMLLDLGRNDVGKISIGGSVNVTASMVIEKYSRVMHLVSEVQGKIEKGKDAKDAIKATFPAGTVSGAPKIQAIKTIEKLEQKKRGVYSGLIGYFERNGDFDSCIVIRSAVHIGNKIYLQAGAGIVYDSEPEKEYEETQNKMMALLNALNLCAEDN